jgi:hypothetical protein
MCELDALRNRYAEGIGWDRADGVGEAFDRGRAGHGFDLYDKRTRQGKAWKAGQRVAYLERASLAPHATE